MLAGELALTIAALFSRLPLLLPYSAIVSAICFAMQRLPRGTALLVDNTWVGRGVYDILRHEGQAPIGVTHHWRRLGPLGIRSPARDGAESNAGLETRGARP
jgi:hypothetical protein